MAATAPTAPRPRRRPLGAPPTQAAVPHGRIVPLALLAIVAVYLGTRLALVWRLPPFWDEAGYGEWAYGAAQGASTRWLSMLEGKEPLTSWLGALWIHAGVPYMYAVRLVSVLAGGVTLTMLWLLGRRASTTAALVAMGLYAALPLFVVHDAMGLMEPTVTALAMCTLYLTIRLAERPSLDTALLLGLATGAGLLVKQSALFTLAMVPLGLIMFDWRGAAVRRRLAAWGGHLLVAAVVCLGCWSILMLSPDWRTYVRARDQFHRPIGDVLSDPIAPLSKNGGELFSALSGYVGPVLMVLVLVGLWTWGRRNWRLATLVGLWGALPFLGTLLLTATGGYPRYWLPSIAPLCLPMSVGVVAMVRTAGRRVARGWPRGLALCAVVALTAVLPASLLIRVLAHPDSAKYPGNDDGQYVTSWAAGAGWRAVADYLDDQTHGAPFTIAYDRARPLWVYLDHWQRAQQVPIGQPAAQTAQFLVKNYADPPLSPAENAAFRLVRSFPRPRDGQPILLYAHR